MAAEIESFTPLDMVEADDPPLDTTGSEAGDVEDQIRELMWNKVGIVRSDERLAAAAEELDALAGVPVASDGSGPSAMRARQIHFMRDVARLIVRAAWRRRESRGLHYTTTYPYRDNERYLRDTILAR